MGSDAMTQDTEWAREQAERLANDLAYALRKNSLVYAAIKNIETALLAAEQRGREAERAKFEELAEAATVCTLLTTFAPFMDLKEGKRLIDALVAVGKLKKDTRP